MFLGRTRLSQNALKVIKNIEPYYPFVIVDKFQTLDKNIDLDILDNDMQFFTNLNFNPFYFKWCDILDHRDFFRSTVNINNKEQTFHLLYNKQI